VSLDGLVTSVAQISYNVFFVPCCALALTCINWRVLLTICLWMTKCVRIICAKELHYFSSFLARYGSVIKYQAWSDGCHCVIVAQFSTCLQENEHNEPKSNWRFQHNGLEYHYSTSLQKEIWTSIVFLYCSVLDTGEVGYHQCLKGEEIQSPRLGLCYRLP